MTQEKFAERAGLSYKVYQSMEAGRRCNPRLSTIELIARMHGMTVSKFFQAPKRK